MNRLALAAILLANTVSAPAHEEAITPTEMLTGKREALWDNTTQFRIRFDIAAVTRRTTIFPDDSRHRIAHLIPAESAPHGFSVAISRELEADFARIGVTDLEKHFTGASIEMEGIVSQTGLDLIGQETIWTYHINLRSFDQIHKLAFPSAPPKRGDNATPRSFKDIDEFFAWADEQLNSGNFKALLAAQTDPRDTEETSLASLRKLKKTLGRHTLAQHFDGSQFSTAHDTFKLGGHNHYALGHCHIDFFKSDGLWRLERIWHCR